MNTLPTKPQRVEPNETQRTPTWRELAERLRDLMKERGRKRPDRYRFAWKNACSRSPQA